MMPSLPQALARCCGQRRAAHAHVGATAVALWFTAAVALPSTVSAEIVVHDAWMGAVPPTSKVAAVYLVVENNGPSAVQIGSATSSRAPRIELHQSVHEDGRVRMERQEGLELAPGEKLDFSVTGHHFMLYFGDQPVPSPGERIDLSLDMPEGGGLSLDVDVRRPGDGNGDGTGSDDDHSHHGHEHHHHHEHGHEHRHEDGHEHGHGHRHQHGHHHEHSQHSDEHGGH